MRIILLDFDGTLAGRSGGNPLVFNESLIDAVNDEVKNDPENTIVIGFTSWLSHNYRTKNATPRDEIIQGLAKREMKLDGMYTTFSPFYIASQIAEEALPQDNAARQEKCLDLMNAFYEQSIASLDQQYVNIKVAKEEGKGTEVQHTNNNTRLADDMKLVELKYTLPSQNAPSLEEYKNNTQKFHTESDTNKAIIAKQHSFEATSKKADQNKEEMLRSIMAFFGTDENTFVLFDDKLEVIEEAQRLANENLPIHHYHVKALQCVPIAGKVIAEESDGKDESKSAEGIANNNYQCYTQTLNEARDPKSIKDALSNRDKTAEQKKLMQDEAHLNKLRAAVQLAQKRYEHWYNETNQSPWESKPSKQNSNIDLQQETREIKYQNTLISTFFLHTAKGQKNAENFATRIQQMNLNETFDAIEKQFNKGAWNTHSFNSFLADAVMEINNHNEKPHYLAKEYTQANRNTILQSEIKFHN